MSQRPTLTDLRRIRSHVSKMIERRNESMTKTQREVSRLSSELKAIDAGITYQEAHKPRRQS